MRGLLTGTLFALALVLAACGGGGGSSSALPNAGTNPGNTLPAKSKTTQANVKFYIPPANKQNARSKPLYISSATQAFAVYVEAYPSIAPTGFPSPLPTGIQVFPVVTPSPCAVASAGGETCTFTVTAPIGTDLFVVAALPTTTLNPGTTPLSAYLSGPVVVSLSPAPSASPLSFSLNGVVNSAAIAVASPDPKNTPNTQVFSVLAPTSAPLTITAYDANNNLVLSPASQPFFTPIVINASPSAKGVTLSLIGTSQCGSTASGSQASIGCAADLNNVQVSYDGSTHPDSNDHAISTFTVAATAQPNPSPSPANIVLASNVVTYPLVTGTTYASYAWLIQSGTSGELLYAFNTSTSPEIGTFTTNTAAVSTAVTLSGVSSLGGIAVAPNGTLWALDSSSYVIDCWNSVSSAIGGASPSVTGFAPLTPTSDSLYLYALTVDGANNVWFGGYDGTTAISYAGYYAAASGCPTSTPSVTANYTLSGDNYESGKFMAPLANGVAYNSNSSGLFEILAASAPGPVTAIVPALGSGSSSGGAAVDPAGNMYGAFTNFTSYTADVEWLSGGTLAPLINPLVPSNNSVNGNADPYGLSVFSATGTTADRAAYADNDFEALGLVDNLHATPTNILDALPSSYSTYQPAYGPNGAVFIIYQQYNGSTYSMYIARAVNTTTWSVPVTSVGGGSCTLGALLSIDERGDSGPFTVTAAPSGTTTFTQLPGSDHDYWVTTSSSGTTTVQLTITDANGRQSVIPTFSVYTGSAC